MSIETDTKTSVRRSSCSDTPDIEHIKFELWGREHEIIRDGDFCDVTTLSNNKKYKLTVFKAKQKQFLEKVEAAIGEPPVRTEDRKCQQVHNKVLERVLRWWGADEDKIIDKVVSPDERTIGGYKYDKLEVLVHLKTKKVNITRFCSNIFKKSANDWLRLKSTEDLFRLYCKLDMKIETDNPKDHIVTKGMGHSSNDVWIPQDLLPMLAVWCSPEYAFVASKILTMYHEDPLKMAHTAIKKHDEMTGLHTVAVLHSTDDIDEHNRVLEEMQHRVKELERENEHLTHTSHLLEIDKKALASDNSSIREQALPFFALRDAHGVKDITNITMNRKQMLDKHMAIFDLEMSDRDNKIRELTTELELVKASKESLERDNHTMSYELEQAVYDKNVLESELSTRKPKKSRKETKRQYSTRMGGTTTLLESVAPPMTAEVLSVYTKNEGNKRCVALVPGHALNWRKLDFSARGSIVLNKGRIADTVLSVFNNAHPSIRHNSFTYVVDNPEKFEVTFTEFMADCVSGKTTLAGYDVDASEVLLSY
jgi:hypothetical protein